VPIAEGPWRGFIAPPAASAFFGDTTLLGLLSGAMERLFNTDRGLMRTLVGLSVNPGEVIRDYLAGRTIRYMHPIAYLIIAFAAFAVVSHFLGSVTGGDHRFFLATLVLFVAATSRLTFFRARLNFAEHAILNIYLFAQAALFLTVVQFIIHLTPGSGQKWVAAGALALSCAYVAWGYSGVFRKRRILSALGGLISLGLGVLLWFLTLAGLIQLIRM
jgi:hypothetical protein